jgi:hypothetical protein
MHLSCDSLCRDELKVGIVERGHVRVSYIDGPA